MKSTRTSFRNTMWFSLLLIASLAVQGCFPYTSGYIPDPTRTQVVKGIDPKEIVSKTTKIELDVFYPESEPVATELRMSASQKRTGPELETTRVFEQRYKNYWAPLAIPLGLLGIAEIPIVLIVSPFMNDNPFAGCDPKGCGLPKGFLSASFYYAVGHNPTCETVGEERITESSRPLGGDVTEESVYPGAKLQVKLTETNGKIATQRVSLETDGNGKASIPLTTLFLTLSESMSDVEAVVSLEADSTVSAKAPISSEVFQAVMGPIRAERAGDRAAKSGKGMIALEHYSRAAEMGGRVDLTPGLWKKISATYRTLPVKPPVPEETRRLLVQAMTLANSNDASGAIEKLSKAIRTAPWLPVLRFNLAMAQAMNGDYAAAINSMNVYLELTPNAPDARQANDKIYEWETLKATAPSQPTGGRGR